MAPAAIMETALETNLVSKRTFTSTEVCKILGITYRQLDYWTRKGYVPSSSPTPGSGHARAFTFPELLMLRLVGLLLEAGFTVTAAFDVARSYDEGPVATVLRRPAIHARPHDAPKVPSRATYLPLVKGRTVLAALAVDLDGLEDEVRTRIDALA
jgi:DNA-binding transcriptional MerR regulator